MTFIPPSKIVTEDMVRRVVEGTSDPWHMAASLNAMMRHGYCTDCGMAKQGCARPSCKGIEPGSDNPFLKLSVRCDTNLVAHIEGPGQTEEVTAAIDSAAEHLATVTGKSKQDILRSHGELPIVLAIARDDWQRKRDAGPAPSPGPWSAMESEAYPCKWMILAASERSPGKTDWLFSIIVNGEQMPAKQAANIRLMTAAPSLRDSLALMTAAVRAYAPNCPHHVLRDMEDAETLLARILVPTEKIPEALF